MNIGSTREFQLTPDVAAKVLAPASAITVFGTILFVVGYFVRQTRLHSRWLVDAQQQALKSSEAKSALMRSVSHEMLTPLHAISGYAELLNTDARSGLALNSEQVERHSQQILTSSQTLRQIIENIFDFANWQSENGASASVTVPVLEIFETVKSRFLDAIRNKGLTLNTRIDRDLRVEANPVWAASVFKQVLDNAVKYSHQEGTIDVSARPVEGGMLEILFKDDGPGFPLGTSKNAFDAFERLGHETGTTSGIGVGLPMAQNFATAMGGQIIIDETATQGAQVRILLPQALDA
jgi:signal transduction histidine kinase